MTTPALRTDYTNTTVSKDEHAKAHNDVNGEVTRLRSLLATPSAGSRLYVPEPGRTYLVQDEFDSTTRRGTLVRSATSGLDYRHTSEATLVRFTQGDAAKMLTALMYPLPAGATFPLDLEIGFTGRFAAFDFTAFGPIMADGVTYGAGTQIVGIASVGTTFGASGLGISARRYTGYNTEVGAHTNVTELFYGELHMRLRWRALNTFAVEVSVDGLEWTALEEAQRVVAQTLTPTHVGFFASMWGTAAARRSLALRYLRAYTPDPPATRPKTPPTVTSGLWAQYDANSLSQYDGDAITTWNDDSGNGRHATLPTGATRIPLWREAGANGRPAVVFDNTPLNIPATPSGPLTVLAVARNTNTTLGSIILSRPSDNGQTYLYLEQNAQAAFQPTGGTRVNAAAAVGTLGVLSARVSATDHSVAWNSGARTSAASSNLSLLLTSLGGYHDAQYAMRGPVSEVLIYNRALTNDELTTQINQLKIKWGIA